MALKECTKKEQANSYELEVNVDGETFGNAVNRVYKKQVKSINIPGFRKGKAPRHVIEKMYGSEVFYEDAMQDCYPDALYEAAKEAGIKIVSVETLEAIEASKEGFSFKANVVVEPEMEINDYLGIEVTKKSTEVTDELVDEEIEKVRDRNSRMVTVDDRAAQNDDVAVIDFEGFVDGEAFEGGKAENYNLKLGSGNFIPGFEEQIVGHKTGEEFTITVKFPDDYQAEELKGKEAEFKINLHEIKAKELPEVDDQISEKLMELLEGEIPEAMYDNQANEMVREFDMRLRSQGLDMKTYMQYMGMDANALKGMYKEEAEKRVKLRLALEAVARKENIEVTEADLDAEYGKMAEAYKMDVDKVKEAVPAESLTEDVKVEKALNLVKDKAVIK